MRDLLRWIRASWLIGCIRVPPINRRTRIRHADWVIEAEANGETYESPESAATTPFQASEPGLSDHSSGTLTTIASWVERAITTTASVSGDGFSSRCGTRGGTQT